MSEGMLESNPIQPQPASNESNNPGSEQTKARSIRDFIPQRLKGLFNRQQPENKQRLTAPNTESASSLHEEREPSTTEPVNTPMTSQEESSQVQGEVDTPHQPAADKVSVTDQIATMATQVGTTEQRSLTQVGETSPVHPDIEEGAKHILEKKLVDAVSIGNTAGIEVSIRQLAEAWEHAQKAANSTFELTPEGKLVIPERVKQICLDHMQDGLSSIYKVAEYSIQTGLEHSITTEPERVAGLYKIADEFQIPLVYSPPQPEISATENALAVTITTREEALTHIQEVIDKNLPRGVQGLVKQLGFQVGQGLLNQMPDYEQRLERWVDIMQSRGWTVVDQPATPLMGEEEPGLIPRQVNRAEIRQLVDQAVSENLAKGAKKISEMVAFKVKLGWFDPLSAWGTPENIALYTEAGQRYGLTHKGGLTAETGAIVDPDKYFDPTELPAHIKVAVIQNLPAGLEAIQKTHLSNIHLGDAEQIEFSERTLDQYLSLANEYGISVNSQQLKDAMASHITSGSLQQGVVGRLNAMREALRKANYFAVSGYSRKAEQFRKFVYDRGFDDKVDFSELDRYLQETATEIPRLTASADDKTL